VVNLPPQSNSYSSKPALAAMISMLLNDSKVSSTSLI